MARIFYSMSGEGRGHATRVRAIVEALRSEHEIAIFAPGDAYDLLAPAYAGTDVHVRRIPGLRFFYTPDGKLDVPQTAARNARFFLRYPKLRRHLRRVMERERPDLIVTDFEPALPRAARSLGIPFVSLNHQHFLIVNDLSELPTGLRHHAWLMSWVVGSYYSGMARTIVSSFYFPPLKPAHGDAVQVGVILRPIVRDAEQRRDGHLVAYLRKFAPENVLDALARCGKTVFLYGQGAKPRRGDLHFLPIDEESFVRHLATSEALVTTAGNQLVGEALYLGKPVLAMPEPNNQEQYINAWFLEKEGTGEWVELERLTTQRLRRFIARLDVYRQRIDPARYDGTARAVAALRETLEARKRR